MSLRVTGRNLEFEDLMIDFGMDFIIAAFILDITPHIFAPCVHCSVCLQMTRLSKIDTPRFVVALATKIPKAVKKATTLLGPLIEQHLADEGAEGKDWPSSKPASRVLPFVCSIVRSTS
jgi:hypothetical protein